MMWANNSEFCFFAIFAVLKPRYHFKARNWFYAPILVRNDISHECNYQIFCSFVFKMAAGGHLGFYPLKKTREVNQSSFPAANLSVQICFSFFSQN